MTDYYGTTTLADAYHTARGNDEWTGDDATKAAALLVASEWIDTKYRSQFPGTKTGARAQLREWPRTGAYDMYGYSIAVDEIPDEIKNATYEVALREIASPGSLNTDVTMGEAIQQVSVSGAVSVTYRGAGSPLDMQLSIPLVDRILSGILTGDASTNGLSGRSERV